jgi:hypothetical protein
VFQVEILVFDEDAALRAMYGPASLQVMQITLCCLKKHGERLFHEFHQTENRRGACENVKPPRRVRDPLGVFFLKPVNP